MIKKAKSRSGVRYAVLAAIFTFLCLTALTACTKQSDSKKADTSVSVVSAAQPEKDCCHKEESCCSDNSHAESDCCKDKTSAPDKETSENKTEKSCCHSKSSHESEKPDCCKGESSDISYIPDCCGE